MRRAGSRSTRIFSMSVTPLRVSRRSAWMQNGQEAVEYISTRAIACSFLYRQPGILPRAKTASQAIDIGEPQPGEHRTGGATALTPLAVRDHRTRRELGEFVAAIAQFRQRNVHGVGQPPAREFLLLADVEQHRVLPVDELRHLERAAFLHFRESP